MNAVCTRRGKCEKADPRDLSIMNKITTGFGQWTVLPFWTRSWIVKILVYLCFMFSISSPVKLNTLNVATKQWRRRKIFCIDLSIISTSLIPSLNALKSMRSLLTMPTDLLFNMLYITHKKTNIKNIFVRFIMSSLVSQKPGKSRFKISQNYPTE